MEVTEQRTDRRELGGIPTRGAQHNWRYAVISGPNGEKHLRLRHNERVYNFRAEGDITEQQFRDQQHLPLTRLPDMMGDHFHLGGDVEAQGTLQVHRSTPDEIYGTMQDGKRNATVSIRHDGEGGWRLEPQAPRPKPRQLVQDFVGAVKEAKSDKEISESLGTIAVDLDGTLAFHVKGQGIGFIGKPIASMRRLVRLWTRRGRKVVIFTARAADPKNIPAIKKWLEQHGMAGLEITNKKTPDMVEFWDDRAVEVKRNQGTSKEGRYITYDELEAYGRSSEEGRAATAAVDKRHYGAGVQARFRIMDPAEKTASMLDKVAPPSGTLPSIPKLGPIGTNSSLHGGSLQGSSLPGVAAPTLRPAGSNPASATFGPPKPSNTLAPMALGGISRWQAPGTTALTRSAQDIPAGTTRSINGVPLSDAPQPRSINGVNLPAVPASPKVSPAPAKPLVPTAPAPKTLARPTPPAPAAPAAPAATPAPPAQPGPAPTPTAPAAPAPAAPTSAADLAKKWQSGVPGQASITPSTIKAPSYGTSWEAEKAKAQGYNQQAGLPDPTPGWERPVPVDLNSNTASAQSHGPNFDPTTSRIVLPRWSTTSQQMRAKSLDPTISGLAPQNVEEFNDPTHTVMHEATHSALHIPGGTAAADTLVGNPGANGATTPAMRHDLNHNEMRDYLSQIQEHQFQSTGHRLETPQEVQQYLSSKGIDHPDDSVFEHNISQDPVDAQRMFRAMRQQNRQDPTAFRRTMQWQGQVAPGLVQNSGNQIGKLASLLKLGDYRDTLLDRIRTERPKVHTAPTRAQQDAGNYRKGHVWIQGLDVTIENPKGSTRSGTAKDGTKWSVKMRNDYGYIRNHPRSEADGDHVDVFVGPHPDSGVVFIVDQQVGGKFDEHKCMVGWTNQADAKTAYLDNFDANWKGFQAITPLTIQQFKRWLQVGDTARPLAGQAIKDFAKHAHFMDPVSAPIWTNPLPVGLGLGGLYGAGAGLAFGGARKLKRWAMNEPDDGPSLMQSAGTGALMGAGVTGLFRMAGTNPIRTPVEGYVGQDNLQGRGDVAKTASSGLAMEIANDPTIPSWRKAEIIAELDRAQSMGIPLTPQQLSFAGLGAAAGWLLARMGGAGGFGQAAAALAGGAFGGWLGSSPSTQINGSGFYRP